LQSTQSAENTILKKLYKKDERESTEFGARRGGTREGVWKENRKTRKKRNVGKRKKSPLQRKKNHKGERQRERWGREGPQVFLTGQVGKDQNRRDHCQHGGEGGKEFPGSGTRERAKTKVGEGGNGMRGKTVQNAGKGGKLGLEKILNTGT